MTRTERESKKGVSNLQQKVKRRAKVTPGEPTDVGGWTGSTSTKYRWASFQPSLFGLAFVLPLAFNCEGSLISFFKETFTLTEIMTKKYSLVLAETLTVPDDFSYYRPIGPTSVITFASSLALKINLNLTESLSFVETCSPVKS